MTLLAEIGLWVLRTSFAVSGLVLVAAIVKVWVTPDDDWDRPQGRPPKKGPWE